MEKQIDSMGYYITYAPDHHRARGNGMTYVHYIVAEQKLGRLLRDGETVHHEDENKLNNHPDNLYVFVSRADHTRFHKTGRRLKIEDYWVSPSLVRECEVCGTEFNYTDSNEESAKYCSIKCQGFNNRKVERLSKDELFQLIKTKPFTKIGEEYGVSDNAVRKWCKSYDLPYKKKDLKMLDKSIK